MKFSTLFTLFICGVLSLVFFFSAPYLAPLSKRVTQKIKRICGFPTSPQPSSSKPLPSLPDKFYPEARMDLVSLFNGMKLKTQIQTEEGDIASRERLEDESYLLDLTLNIQVPQANQTLSDLKEVNPKLDQVLPGLPELLPTASVSDFYHSLYQRKVTFTRNRLTKFNQLLTRHNFFDCDTILELKSPTTGRKVLLIQADMDVVTDGTDSDRSLTYDSSSRHFQPFTSYSYPKTGKTPNPFLKTYREKIDSLSQQISNGTLSGTSKQKAQRTIRRLKSYLPALKYRSSLVAHLDPFIVVPGFMIKYKNNDYAPQIGDYALVIHQDRAYPAIVGDSGPYSKIGEASLLICKAIDPKSSGVRRAMSKLSISYLIFPRSRDRAFSSPDLPHWQKKCSDLAQEIGGLGVELHDWTQKEDTEEKEQKQPAPLN